MQPSEFRLGFDHIRAAIVGGHNLLDAWKELVQLVNMRQNAVLAQGGLACLLLCFEEMDRHGLLSTSAPNKPVQDFLEAGSIGRAKTLGGLLSENRSEELLLLVLLMVNYIELIKGRFVFSGVYVSIKPTPGPDGSSQPA